jgi:hypothetical protein
MLTCYSEWGLELVKMRIIKRCLDNLEQLTELTYHSDSYGPNAGDFVLYAEDFRDGKMEVILNRSRKQLKPYLPSEKVSTPLKTPVHISFYNNMEINNN